MNETRWGGSRGQVPDMNPPNALTYLPEFKVKAVLSYIGGTSP